MARLFAMSEVQWSEPANKNFETFSAKVKTWGFRMLELKGFNYRNK